MCRYAVGGAWPGYSVSPDWLPGSVDSGFTFNGRGADGWDAGAPGFRSVPDTWPGGVFSIGTGLSFEGVGSEGPLSGLSGRPGYVSPPRHGRLPATRRPCRAGQLCGEPDSNRPITEDDEVVVAKQFWQGLNEVLIMVSQAGRQ